jgi:hypothetical protein
MSIRYCQISWISESLDANICSGCKHGAGPDIGETVENVDYYVEYFNPFEEAF